MPEGRPALLRGYQQINRAMQVTARVIEQVSQLDFNQRIFAINSGSRSICSRHATSSAASATEISRAGVAMTIPGARRLVPANARTPSWSLASLPERTGSIHRRHRHDCPQPPVRQGLKLRRGQVPACEVPLDMKVIVELDRSPGRRRQLLRRNRCTRNPGTVSFLRVLESTTKVNVCSMPYRHIVAVWPEQQQFACRSGA